MKQIRIAALVAAALINAPAMADMMLASQITLTTNAADKIARAALSECRKQGYTVTVAVVDRAGVPLVMLRDNNAGAHTPSIAINKAWTAVNFRASTTDLVAVSEPGKPAAAIRNLPNIAILGGGLMIQAKGSPAGAIGVSGAPGGHLDENCALAGIRAIGDRMEHE